MSRTADETLRRIGRRQGSAQRLGEIEAEHGERFVEAFTDTFGRAGVIRLQTPREIGQQATGRCDVGTTIGALQDRLRPGRWRSSR